MTNPNISNYGSNGSTADEMEWSRGYGQAHNANVVIPPYEESTLDRLASSDHLPVKVLAVGGVAVLSVGAALVAFGTAPIRELASEMMRKIN